MNKKQIYLVIPVIITITGVAYMGYADSKGLNNSYGELMIGLGLFFSMFNLLFRNRKENSKES